MAETLGYLARNDRAARDVTLVGWPADAAKLDALRAVGVPRLLLVDPETAAPDILDPLEDWIRLPAAEDDVRARVATLAARSLAPTGPPLVDADGLLHFQARWVALSPVERAITGALIERFGAVVGRDVLSRRAWPGGAPTRNALDVRIVRLRRRIAPLGLEISTVRARGYLLQAGVG
jgi:hypothetical protein